MRWLVLATALALTACAAPAPDLPPSTIEQRYATPRLHAYVESTIEPTQAPTATPTPQPTPTTAPTSTRVTSRPTQGPAAQFVAAGVEQWRELVTEVFGAGLADYVLRLINCESGGNPRATGAAGERGLTQVHPIHPDSTYDPRGNLIAAYRISGGGRDWSAWSCR